MIHLKGAKFLLDVPNGKDQCEARCDALNSPPLDGYAEGGGWLFRIILMFASSVRRELKIHLVPLI